MRYQVSRSKVARASAITAPLALALVTVTTGAAYAAGVTSTPGLLSLDADDLAPNLAIAQTSRDVLSLEAAQILDRSTLAVQERSTRLLDDTDGARYWLAQSGADQICLVAEYTAAVGDEGEPITGVATACDTRTGFGRDGVSLDLSTADENGTVVASRFALLLPDGLDDSALLDAGLSPAGGNLLLGDSAVPVQRQADAVVVRAGSSS